MHKEKKTFQLIVTAILAAVTMVVTMLIHIPIPSAQGYLNIGDTVIMLTGSLLGAVPGFTVGSIGSALADILSGYAVYAPFTLVVKGLEGFLVGYIFRRSHQIWPATIIAGLVMAIGYLLTDIVLYSFAVAIVAFPMNIGQGIFSAALTGLLYRPLSHVLKSYLS